MVDDGCRQAAEQVPHDVHSVLVSNGIVLKPTNRADEKTQRAHYRDPLKTLPDPKPRQSTGI